MSNKSFKEVQQLSRDEVLSKIRDTEAGLFSSRMQKATGQLKDTSSIWRSRKLLARLKTRLTQMSAAKQ